MNTNVSDKEVKIPKPDARSPKSVFGSVHKFSSTPSGAIKLGFEEACTILYKHRTSVQAKNPELYPDEPKEKVISAIHSVDIRKPEIIGLLEQIASINSGEPLGIFCSSDPVSCVAHSRVSVGIENALAVLNRHLIRSWTALDVRLPRIFNLDQVITPGPNKYEVLDAVTIVGRFSRYSRWHIEELAKTSGYPSVSEAAKKVLASDKAAGVLEDYCKYMNHIMAILETRFDAPISYPAGMITSGVFGKWHSDKELSDAISAVDKLDPKVRRMLYRMTYQVKGYYGREYLLPSDAVVIRVHTAYVFGE